MPMSERVYYLNKAIYNIHIAPTFKMQNFTPKLLIQFAIILPFQLPFPSKRFVTHEISDEERYTYTFEDRIIENQMLIGTYREEDSKIIKSAKTRIEMNYFNAVNIEEDDMNEEYLNDIFDNLLNHLNKIIVAYLIKTKDTSAFKVTKEMLPSSIHCRYISNFDFDKSVDKLLMLNLQVPFIKDTLPLEDFLSIQQFAMFIKNDINPFVISEEFMLGAKRRYKEGNYKEAVVYAQTSIETFLTTLYKSLCREEGKEEQLIEEQLNYPNFRGITQFAKEKFQKRIGGNWDIRDKKSIVGKWHLYTNKLRNKIVHSGYEPNFRETDEACHSATMLRLYIIDLLKKYAKKYPKCNELIYSNDK